MIGQYWIARDADGSLSLYNYRPAFIGADEIIEYDHFGFAGADQRYTFGDRPIVKELPADLFPEVTFERSPIQLTVGGLMLISARKPTTSVVGGIADTPFGLQFS